MRTDQIALQLYTLRAFCQTADELAQTAGKVRAIGYQAVQVSGIGPIPAPQVAGIMRDHGLTICATHEPANILLEEPERAVERLGLLGCALTAFPFPGQLDLRRLDVVEDLVRRLERAGALLRQNGMTLGYHNHAIEFTRLGDATVLDYIYAHTSPRNLVAELDTYWVQYGGGNVLEWVARMASRMPFIHLKDYMIGPDQKPTWCEIGEGVLPMRRIVDLAEAGGCRWFIVEQDSCTGDPFESVALSYRRLSSFALPG